jgi:hypothetical protein
MKWRSWVRRDVPLEESEYAGVVIKLIEFFTILGGNELIEGLNVIEMAFSDEEIILKISRLLVNDRHDLCFDSFLYKFQMFYLLSFTLKSIALTRFINQSEK